MIPGHDYDDYKICIKLGLSSLIFVYDEYGTLQSCTKQFVNQPLEKFEDNIIKFLEDIGNLDSTRLINSNEYIHCNTNKKLYPLLRDNIYMNI